MTARRVECSGKWGCGATWTGLKLEHCTVCHRTFTTTRNGDMHQVGPWSSRRCLTDEELAEKGRLHKNSSGYWAGVPRIDATAGPAAPVNDPHTPIDIEMEVAL